MIQHADARGSARTTSTRKIGLHAEKIVLPSSSCTLVGVLALLGKNRRRHDRDEEHDRQPDRDPGDSAGAHRTRGARAQSARTSPASRIVAGGPIQLSSDTTIAQAMPAPRRSKK